MDNIVENKHLYEMRLRFDTQYSERIVKIYKNKYCHILIYSNVGKTDNDHDISGGLGFDIQRYHIDVRQARGLDKKKRLNRQVSASTLKKFTL